jgi:leucyl aminopeptidase
MITDPIRMKDMKQNNFGIFLPFFMNPNFSEKMLLVAVPNKMDEIRSLTSKAFKSLISPEIDKLHIIFADSLPLHNRRIITTSLLMSNYSFKICEESNDSTSKEENDKIFIKKCKTAVIKEFIFNLSNDPTNTRNLDSFKLWVNLANSTLFTRNLANRTPSIGNCDYFELVARKIINNNIKDKVVNIEVIKGMKLKKNGLNLIYAVGKSSEAKPRIIILSYKGRKGSDKFSHAIIGNGITFDTGGLNLKKTNYIENTHLNKHGACNVLSIFKTIVEMNLTINLVCAIGVAENPIDGLSSKPSDIIMSYKGYTVEITNTEADDRLVLADTLSYVQDKYKPDNIIDLANLTEACRVALGNRTAGLFSNNKIFASDVIRAATEVLEYVWFLPINNEHKQNIESKFANFKNDNKYVNGGASNAAAFLSKFINKGVNWVHLDISG